LDFFEFTAGERKENKTGFLPIFRHLALISASFDGCFFSEG